MPLETTLFDVADDTDSPEMTAAYLEAAMESAAESGDHTFVEMALDAIARAGFAPAHLGAADRRDGPA